MVHYFSLYLLKMFILIQLSKDKEELHARLDVDSKIPENNILKSNLNLEQNINESMQQNNMK